MPRDVEYHDYSHEIKKLSEAQLVRWLNVAGTIVRDAVKRSMSGPSPSRPGQPPAIQTGAYRRSITYEVDRGKMDCRIGPAADAPGGSKRAYALEYGAVITPTSAQWLVFPVRIGTQIGRDKKTGRMKQIRRAAKVETVPGRKFRKLRKGPKGKETWEQKRLRGGGLYRIVKTKRVVLRARPHLRPGLHKSEQEIVRALERIKVVP